MSLVIFDYDDTLFPTSFIQGRKTLTKQDIQDFQALDVAIVRLMTAIKDAGHQIVIISNGSGKWITDSISTYLPSFGKFTENITIFSARDTYEPTKIAYKLWKKYATVNTCVYPKFVNVKSIIGVGDSDNDQESIELASDVVDKPSKFIKYPQRMSLATLVEAINGTMEIFRGF